MVKNLWNNRIIEKQIFRFFEDHMLFQTVSFIFVLIVYHLGVKKIILELGKGSKIKLIIFAEFSANGGWVPPIRENN